MTKRPTNYRIRKGMAIVPENRRLFAPMTVLENLKMGAYLRGGGDDEDYERVYTLFPRVYERRSQLAGTLSGGEQQMVAMGRALMSHPKLLLMDEPSMGLAPILVEKSFEIIKQVNDEGVAVLVVEQNANVSLSIADRGYVLSTGPRRARGRGRRPDRERRPAEGLPWPLRRQTVAERCRHRFPIFERLVYVELVLAGRALGCRARGLRRLPDRLGRPRRAVGLLGRAQRDGARDVRPARQRRAPADVAVTTSVSAGVSAVASALDFERRPRVVVSDFEFPTVGQIWHAQELRGAEVVHVPADGSEIPLERFAEAIDERTALVAVTAVCFRNGARLPIEEIAELAHERGALVLLDAYQAVGHAIRSTSRRSASTSSRRACSSTCSRRPGSRSSGAGTTSSSELTPTQTGWFADRDIFEMDIHDYSPSPTATRFQSGTPPVPAIYAGHRRDGADGGDRHRGHARARERAERAADRRRRRARRHRRHAARGRAARRSRLHPLDRSPPRARARRSSRRRRCVVLGDGPTTSRVSLTRLQHRATTCDAVLRRSRSGAGTAANAARAR